MGNVRAQKNKPHKSRFSSKSSRNLHKENTEKRPSAGAKRSHQVSIAQNARASRLNHNKNLRDKKKAALLNEKRMGADSSPPPLILAIITLSSKTNSKNVKALLIEQINKSESNFENDMEIEDGTLGDIPISNLLCRRHKLRFTIIEASHGDLEGCLMVAKVADAIAFVTAATSEKDQIIDKDGKICLSMLRAQGLPTIFALTQGLVDVPVKKRSDVKKACSSVLGAEMPEGSKLFFADEAAEYELVLRYLSDHRLSFPQWRSNRPYVLAQRLEFVPDSQAREQGTLLVSGYVRGRGLSVNQLVHLTGLGDYQLHQIDMLEDPCPLRRDHKRLKEVPMELEKVSILRPHSVLQEQLVVENIPDPLAGEQTWPTEDELAKAEEERKGSRKGRLLPKGTSEYQAAWIVDDVTDHEESDEDSHDETMEGVDFSTHGRVVEDVVQSEVVINKEEGSLSDEDASILDEDGDDDGQSEMMIEEELTIESRRAELECLKAAHAADAEFPDEVDTPMDVLAKQRFAKYRGLKSLRTSNWDPKESLPQEYGRIFSFENFARTQKSVFARAAEVDDGRYDGSLRMGVFVRLHVKDVSAISASKLLSSYTQIPLVVCGLLQHESKMSVLHFSIRKYENYLEPVKSKDTLVFHVGFRKFKTRPIFSTDDINMDKHKLERFLHPGRFSVASAFAPICFPPLPLVVFKETGGEGLKLVASGSLKSVDSDRIILKKIVLSGYPQRVQKQRAVIRFMFHNPEDVRWFKPLELWTKYGRRGRIKEPVGTHGAMKCVFDGILQQRDAVCVSLYKRVYPKWPEFTS